MRSFLTRSASFRSSLAFLLLRPAPCYVLLLCCCTCVWRSALHDDARTLDAFTACAKAQHVGAKKPEEGEGVGPEGGGSGGAPFTAIGTLPGSLSDSASILQEESVRPQIDFFDVLSATGEKGAGVVEATPVWRSQEPRRAPRTRSSSAKRNKEFRLGSYRYSAVPSRRPETALVRRRGLGALLAGAVVVGVLLYTAHSRRVSRFRSLIARLLPLDEGEVPGLARALEEKKSQGQIWIEIPEPGAYLREKLELTDAEAKNGVVVRAVRGGASLNQYLSFALEAEALAYQRPLDHPLILPHLGIFKGEKNAVYIFYPKTEGSLALYAKKKPSIVDIANSAAQMALAVDELRKKGLVHRSVSLRDFVFDPTGRLRLSNFTFLSQVNSRVDPDAQALWTLRKLVGGKPQNIEDTDGRGDKKKGRDKKANPDNDEEGALPEGEVRFEQVGDPYQVESGDSRLLSLFPSLWPVCCPVVTEETDVYALGLAFQEFADSLQQAINREQSMIGDLVNAGHLYGQRGSSVPGKKSGRDGVLFRDRFMRLEKQAAQAVELEALARKMTQANPSMRPTLAEVLQDELFAGIDMDAVRHGRGGRGLLVTRRDGWFSSMTNYLSNTKGSLWNRTRRH